MNEHGLASTYNLGCRCGACREANRVKSLAARADRARRLRADPSLATHGKHATYVNWDCRCIDCTTAQMDYHRSRADLTTPTT